MLATKVDGKFSMLMTVVRSWSERPNLSSTSQIHVTNNDIAYTSVAFDVQDDRNR